MNKPFRKWFLLALTSLLFFQSCDDSFSPSGPEEQRMVVYSVLTTDSDIQYVRVYQNYFPLDNDPRQNITDHPIKDATVSVSDQTTTFLFRDTLLAREDTSHYKEPVFAYVASGFPAKPGYSYTLKVVSASFGTLSATTRVPDASTLSIHDLPLLDDPYQNANLYKSPSVSFTLSKNAEAYRVRLLIEYDAENTGSREAYQREVPQVLRPIDCKAGIFDFIFPKVTRRSSVPSTGGEFMDTYRFNYFAYRRSIEFVYQTNVNPLFRRIKYFVVQFDGNWYKYYSTARTFQDRFSVRLDDPDFSNIPGGVGLFGSLVVDSTVWGVPTVILPAHPEFIPDCEETLNIK